FRRVLFRSPGQLPRPYARARRRPAPVAGRGAGHLVRRGTPRKNRVLPRQLRRRAGIPVRDLRDGAARGDAARLPAARRNPEPPVPGLNVPTDLPVISPTPSTRAGCAG